MAILHQLSLSRGPSVFRSFRKRVPVRLPKREEFFERDQLLPDVESGPVSPNVRLHVEILSNH
jgi:hypothetical protein